MRRMVHSLVLCAAAACIGAVADALAADDAAQSQAQIRAALTRWLSDFNAGHVESICDLFADELRADVRGQPERNHAALCELLKRSLRDPERAYSYALAIKEIVTWGDTAVVRLVWTLTIREKDKSGQEQSVEPGMDVFRRQADGSWKIVRYMAFNE